MRGMEGIVTEPRRQNDLACVSVRVHGHRVSVSTVRPLQDAGVEVEAEGVFEPAPHARSRVVHPASTATLQGIEDLLRFNTLLAEASIVEHLSSLLEVRKREERLHASK